MSEARISTLFLIWSAVGILAEVPSGALADRFSHRRAVVASGVLQALGYAAWMTLPTFPGFAAGFVLWGLGGALSSGAFEALLYQGMASAGAGSHYSRLYGRVSAAGLVAQLPAAVTATVLFAHGGFALAGWASVACCLAAAALATRLPDTRPAGRGDDAGRVTGSPLRRGLAGVATRPALLAAVAAVALLGSLDGLEEYFPLLAGQWGVATGAVPLAVLGIPMVGAAGAALGGRLGRLAPAGLGVLMVAAVGLAAGAAVLGRAAGVALVAGAYGLYQLVVVVADVELQERIEGGARATVTSLASVGTDLCTVAIYLAWAAGRPALVGAAALGLSLALPWLLRRAPAAAPAAGPPAG